MNIKNSTYLTFEELNSVLTKKAVKKFPPMQLTVVLTVLFGVAAVTALVVNMLNESYFPFWAVLILAACFGACIGLCILPHTLRKNTRKVNSQLIDGLTIDFTMEQDKMTVSSVAQGRSGTATIEYASLYDVATLDNYLLLYSGKIQVYICNLNNFSPEDRELCLNTLLPYSKKARKRNGKV